MRGRCDYENSENWQLCPLELALMMEKGVMHESRKVGGLLETRKGNGSPVGPPEITTVLAVPWAK